MRNQLRQFVFTALVLMAFPVLAVSQNRNTNQNKKTEVKQKEETETIVITRHGNTEAKTVVEISKDRILVNGKEVKEGRHENITVRRLSAQRSAMAAVPTIPDQWDYYNEGFTLLNEDENRAMLGVVTDGKEKGAEIRLITKGSGAEKAGLKKGDIITRIGNKKIECTDDVTEAIKAHKPGDKVVVEYLRDEKQQKVTAELGKWTGVRVNSVQVPNVMGEAPFMERFQFENGMGGSVFTTTGRPKLGLSIQDTDDGRGVKVLEVEDDSNAAKAGLLVDDVILTIDGREISGTDEVTRLFRENREKYTFTFRVLRDGKTQDIEVKMPRKLKTTGI